jgi:nitroreductase
VETSLAIASRRETRRFSDRALPPDVLERILDAGRLAGTASNKQPWRLVVVESRAVRERLAEAVYAPENVRGAASVVALVGSGTGRISAFDAGRIAQNMLLAAWHEGVGSTPNGLPDADEARAALEVAEDENVIIVLSFGYPRRPRDPESRTREEWSARAKRKPLDELVRRV